MSKAPLTLPLGLSAAVAARLYALHVLESNQGNRTQTATALGITFSTLRKWLLDLEATGHAVIAPANLKGRPRKLAATPAATTV